MRDLVVAAAMLLVTSGAMLGLGLRIGRCRSSRITSCASAVLVMLLIGFAMTLHGTLRMAQLVPFSSAIVLGNWITLGGAMLAGIVLGQHGAPLWRRGWLMIFLPELLNI